MPKWMALTKAKATDSGVEDMVMAMDIAKCNQVASVTQVVLSQEDLAETVEPSTHQSSALLSENLLLLQERRSFLQMLSHQGTLPISAVWEEGCA